MNRKEYMNQLSYRLRRLPKEDYDRAMDYFYEYFEEAGQGNEEQAIEDLGSPQNASDQIIQDIARENLGEPVTKKSVKKGFSTIWIVVLAIFASPIALPLALALLACLFAILVTAGAAVFAVAITALGVIAGAVMGVIAGIILIFSTPANGIAIFGASLFMLGAGIVISIGMVKLVKWLAKVLPKLMRKFVKGGRRHV